MTCNDYHDYMNRMVHFIESLMLFVGIHSLEGIIISNAFIYEYQTMPSKHNTTFIDLLLG